MANGAGAEPLQLTILHTSDLRGRLEAMARLSSFASRLKAEAEAEGRRVFLWDAGDAIDRQERICRLSKGAGIAPILNAMGYALQTMGASMAAAYGPSSIAAFAAQARFPVLAANCREDGRPLPAGLHDYVVLPLRQGHVMGVIGLASPFEGLFGTGGLCFLDSREVAQTLVGKLTKQGAAPIVVLSHLGLEADRRLADGVAGIHVILGGGSQGRLVHGEERNGVLIAQAGQEAEALGRLDLTLDPATGHVLDRSATVLGVPADEPMDPAVVAAVAAAQAVAETAWTRPVGHLTSPLELNHFSECSLGNVAVDALREHFGAGAAIVSGGLMRRAIPAGNLTFGQLDVAFPTTASPCLTEVRGEQIRAALERGLSPEAGRRLHPALDGAPMGFPQISGLTVWYDPAGMPGQRVRRVKVQGKLLVSNRIYRLAHTAAETLPGAGCLELESDQGNVRNGLALREVVEEYIRKHTPLAAPRLGRWIAEPQSESGYGERRPEKAA